MDNAADLAVGYSRTTNSNSCIETLASNSDELHGFSVGFGFGTDREGSIEIAVVTFVKEGDVDVEDVAIFEWTLIRNAVADDLVDGAVR